MSRIGQSIIDTPFEDQSSPDEPADYTGDPEPTRMDWAINDLQAAVRVIEAMPQDMQLRYVNELGVERNKLNRMLARIIQ